MLRWLATAAILVAALFFLMLAGGFHLELQEARQLVAAGQAAEGTVTALGAPRRSTAYRYSYAYSVGGAQYSKSDRSIPYSRRDEVPVGTKIRVWYDPKRPEKATTAAELAEHESMPNRLFFPAVGLALLAWALARIVRPRRRATGPGSRGSR